MEWIHVIYTAKKQLLSRYLKDFKHKQTHCSKLQETLDRVSLVFRNQLINKKSLGDFDRLIEEDVWLSLQDELIPVCRFCSEVFCNTHARYFKIKDFTQYLIDQTDVRHSTMREYVIRLRRLDDILLAKNHPAETFSPTGVQQRLGDYLPEKEHMLYRSALRKYDQYLLATPLLIASRCRVSRHAARHLALRQAGRAVSLPKRLSGS